MFLLWRSRHIYDRRAEEILQCNEKVGIQKTAKTYTKTRGKIISIYQANSYLRTANFYWYRESQFLCMYKLPLAGLSVRKNEYFTQQTISNISSFKNCHFKLPNTLLIYDPSVIIHYKSSVFWNHLMIFFNVFAGFAVMFPEVFKQKCSQ